MCKALVGNLNPEMRFGGFGLMALPLAVWIWGNANCAFLGCLVLLPGP